MIVEIISECLNMGDDLLATVAGQMAGEEDWQVSLGFPQRDKTCIQGGMGRAYQR